ncbi:MAG: hypothetical protein SPI86_09595 [Treponemataceae bacterium]|nr:hypothetical protein [Spirochaetales bacterium]MDY6031995.1 hypothetical protein [Treponemataceae bacterium]
MSEYELLTCKMLYCAEKASETASSMYYDEKMHFFWKNAMEGFRLKLENISLAQACRICYVA